MTDRIDYEVLNLTELTTIAKEVNPSASRHLPVEALIAIIEGVEIELPERFLDKKRLKVLRYIDEKWESVRYQISCPAKTRDPRACFTCSDMQITCCILDNKKIFLNEKDDDVPK